MYRFIILSKILIRILTNWIFFSIRKMPKKLPIWVVMLRNVNKIYNKYLKFSNFLYLKYFI